MSKKRNNKESMICLMLKPRQSFFVNHIQSKENLFTEKVLFKEKGEWRIEQNQKEGFLTALAMSIRKHVNELKVHKRTLRTAIKQDLSPDFNPLDYAICGILENKTNATSHPNIGLVSVSLFNGISTFVGYLMPKPFS